MAQKAKLEKPREKLQGYTLREVIPTGKELGKGAYGNVFEVEHCGTLYAAKETHSILLDGVGNKIGDLFVKECYDLSKCHHPNIVQFIGVYYPPFQRLEIPTLVMEKMHCNLRQFVDTNSPISLDKALSILHDVSLGVWYLHSLDPPLMHRDLSPNNILVNTTSLVAKICDFGIIRVLSPYIRDRDDLTQVPGTVHFMPPEAFSYRPVYGLPLDVFSFGGVALFTITGEWPTPAEPIVVDPNTRRIVAFSEVERRQQYLDRIQGDAAALLRTLVEESLNNDPIRRPTIELVSTRIKCIKQMYPDIKTTAGVSSQYLQEQLQQKVQEIHQKNQQINQNDQELRAKEREIRQKVQELNLRDQEIHQNTQDVQQKDQEIQQKDQEILQLNQQMHQQLFEKDQQIHQLQQSNCSLPQSLNHSDSTDWVIQRREITILEKTLGKGGWGAVTEAIFRGCKVAAKCLHNEIVSTYNLGLFNREMNMAARCRHPNILQFIGATNQGLPIIITELMHTSLRKILEDGQLYSNQIIHISLGVAYGLNYLHRTTPDPILHRDVSSANVLLNPLPNSQWHPKLSDFGSTNFVRASNTVNAGNPTYASPEANRGQHSTAMDVFSYGVLMFEMCSRQLPTTQPKQSHLHQVKWGPTESILRNPIWSCLAVEVQRRPDMNYLINELLRIKQ